MKKIFLTFGIVLAILLISKCAKVGTISGGPKDMDPPVMESSEPGQFATNFKGKKIKMNFNEYVQLKEFNQQFNVSPPLRKKPKVYINNKSVFIQYSDTLQDSTTYTMNFGNSLVDNNEGNILENFEFVFSTTSYIDSMGVQGYILDAFTGKPSKDPFLIGLYTNPSDTAPFKIKPTFTGRTNKNGIFRINNVKEGSYRLYAFQDKNNNMKYDPVSESFAFADTVVVLTPAFLSTILPPVEKPDTFKIKKDTLSNRKDSVKKNRLEYDKNKLMVELYSFREDFKKQYIKDYSWKERRKLTVSFSMSLINDESVITPLFADLKDWCQIEVGPNRDSLIYWLTDTSLLKTDSLRCSISYLNIEEKDTVWITDTIKFMYTSDALKKKKNIKDTIVEKMFLKSNVEGNLDLDANPVIEADFPVTNINEDLITLYEKVDTNEVKRKFKIVKDSVYPRKFHIVSNWTEKSSYRLTILPECFENIYGIKHDTLKLNFGTQSLEYYGTYTINISENENENLIVQLLINDKPAYEKYIRGNGNVEFKFIKPATYTLKVIRDTDENRKYTSGDFLEKRQAERVSIYKEPVLVRSNWESTLEWAPDFSSNF